MELRAELERMERCAMDRGVPSTAFDPPVDDHALARLRDAIAPMGPPEDVETLYRWHNGCSLQWLDGYGLQPIGNAIAERAFDIQQLDAAPAWLTLSIPPRSSGSRVVVTLDVPGVSRLGGLWSVETHDAHVSRIHDGLAEAAATTADIITDAAPQVDFTHLWMRVDDLPRPEDAYRLAHSPESFQWPDPPAGTYLSRFADSTWPTAWTTSLRYRG